MDKTKLDQAIEAASKEIVRKHTSIKGMLAAEVDTIIHNHLDSLDQELDVRALAVELDRYTSHGVKCASQDYDHLCDCGLVELRDRLMNLKE